MNTLIWIDELVQKLINEASFFLTRHDVPKLSQCKVLWAIAILSSMHLVAKHQQDSTLLLPSLLLLFGFTFIATISLKAEETSQDDPCNKFARGELLSCIKLLRAIFVPLILCGTVKGVVLWESMDRVSWACDMARAASLFLWLYLVATPNTPPPIKRRQLAPAPA